MIKLFVDHWASTANSSWLNTGEDGKIQIWPCKESKRKIVISWIFTILTVGFLRLVFYWKPLWYALCNCDLCPPENAQLILVKHESQYDMRFVRTAVWTDGLTLFCPGGITIDVPSCRYFTYKKMIFLWHPMVKMFHKIFRLDSHAPLALLASQEGLPSNEANKRLAIFGSNEIAVDLKPIIILLFREAFSPFYVFQVFSVAVWFSEGYNIYAGIIIAVSVLSIGVNVWQTRRNQRQLRNMMYSIGVATVWRDGEWKKKSSTVLVPGDVISVPDNGEMHCDAVLLRGSAVVNEAMLTGESVPTTKTAIQVDVGQSNERYDSKEHAKHTLFCGTKILQTKRARGELVTAVVIRTGFSTTKGQLVRTIMYPKPIEFEFYRDLFRFIGVFVIVAIAGFIYTIVLMVRRGNGFSRIATRSLDIITIVVPPALPAAITIGIIAAQRRLKQASIFCTSPTAINTAGGVNVACFDKTGTLTEDGMDLFGVIPSNKIEDNESTMDVSDLPSDCDLVRVMASCHSLTQLHSQLAGDPMDIVLFRKTAWVLEDAYKPDSDVVSPASVTNSTPSKDHANDHLMMVRSPNGDTRINVLREYSFSSTQRRMSVLARVHCSQSSSQSGLYLYCKGAPETIAGLCEPDSVPRRFLDVLGKYTKCGYRVISMAYKKLDDRESDGGRFLTLPRQELETNLILLGFVLFENRLKDQTVPNITVLKNARLRTIMVTGDNAQTAISVARECGIVDNRRPLYTLEATAVGDQAELMLHVEPIRLNSAKQKPSSVVQINQESLSIDLDEQLGEIKNRKCVTITKRKSLEANYQIAIAGSSYAVIASKLPHLLPNLTAVCDVYARMAPEQKVQVITNLQGLGYIVSMCGDGANDCGALKAAHVGCSLSQAEASIASPFTSKMPDISCMPTLIREGRACLVTTFGIVKYMCSYSLTQFLAVVVLYWIGTNLGDLQFLYSDLILSTTFAIFFGCTRPANRLSSVAPPTHILTVESISSIAAQMALILIFQVFAFNFVETQPWFVPYVFPGDENNYISYQTTCLFFTASFQQIILCIIYSKSYPYRLSIYTNYPLAASLVITTVVTLVLLLSPGPFFIWLLDLKMPPEMKYRGLIIVLALAHFFLATGAEQWVNYAIRLCRCLPIRRQKHRYEEILTSDVASSPNWLHTDIVDNSNGALHQQDRHSNGNGYSNPVFQCTEDL